VRNAAFERLRRSHRAALQALERLDASGAAGGLRAAVGAFLERDAPALEALLAEEERELFAALDACLPQEAEPSAALRREHDTARGLIALLRRAHAARAGDPGDDAALARAVHDLRLLLRDHFRKEDGVVVRLLAHLTPEGGHA
jgi:hypothetical protein